MDPNTKLLLEEMKSMKWVLKKQLAESNLKNDERIKQLDEHLRSIGL